MRFKVKDILKGYLQIKVFMGSQTAADVRWNGFDAGAFTYPLTQYLLQETGTPEGAIAYATRKIT